MKRDEASKRKLLQRLKRVEGQVAAVRRMVEEDTYCVDVLVQIAAARGALGRVGELMLKDHVAHCVSDALQHGDEVERRDKIDELVDVVARYSGGR